MTVTNENRKISYDIDGTSVFTFVYTFDIVDVNTVFLTLFDSDGTDLEITMTRVNSATPSVNEFFVDEDNLQVVIGDGGDTFLQDQYGSDVAQLLITRTVELTQEVSFPVATPLQTDSIELGLDQNIMSTQQVNEILLRTLRLPIQDDTSQVVDLPAAAIRANKFLAFDGLGNPTAGDSPAGGAIISVAMEPVVAAATIAAARILLDVYQISAVDVLLALKLSIDGSIAMTGALNMGTQKINNVVDPAAAQDAATKASTAAAIVTAIAANVSFSAYTNEDSETNALLKDHAYEAQTDGFVVAYVLQGVNARKLRAYVGLTDDPAGAGVLVGAQEPDGDADISISFPVAAGEFFEITYDTGTPTIRWKSMGALSKPVDQD